MIDERVGQAADRERGQEIAGDLGHRHVGASVVRLQRDRHPGGSQRTGTCAQHEATGGVDLEDLGVVVDRERPGANAMVGPHRPDDAGQPSATCFLSNAT